MRVDGLCPTIPDWLKFTVAAWVTLLVWEANGRRGRNESWRKKDWTLQKKRGRGWDIKNFIIGVFAPFLRRHDILFQADNLLLFVFQEVGLVDYHSHHARDYSSHLAQPHRRRPSLLSEFQPGNERLVHCVHYCWPLFCRAACYDSWCFLIIIYLWNIIYSLYIASGYVKEKHIVLHMKILLPNTPLSENLLAILFQRLR